MTRRVVVLNHFAATPGSPGGTRHVELFDRIEGWDATIIAADRNLLTRERTNEDWPGFTTVRTTPYSRNGLLRILNWCSYAFTALLAGLRGPSPDVVYASSPHLLTGLTGYLLARARRASFILEVRDLWPLVLLDMEHVVESSTTYRMLKRLETFLYQKADQIVVLAEGSGRVIADDGIDPARIHFVPNGAEPDDWEPTGSGERCRGSQSPTGLVVAYTGAHGPANGLDLLLDAAAVLKRRQPGVSIVMIGDGPAKRRLIERSRGEGLTNVTFRDPIPKQDMPDLLAGVDVGVHVLADVPLFHYGVSPNKLFDYMAAGLPVLTNTRGDVAAMVTGADAGLAVSPDALADGIEDMVRAGGEQRLIWGKNGREYMRLTHSRTILADRLRHILDDAADHHR